MRSGTSWNCGLSCRCPAVISSDSDFCPARPRGGSSWSDRRGSVRYRGRPARCRPHRAARAADPFFTRAGRVLVGAADGRVHADIPSDQAFRVGLDLQLLEDLLPRAVAPPPAKQVVNPVPRTVPLGDVSPGRASPGPPPYPVDQLPMSPRARPSRLLPRRQQRLQPSPLPVRQIPSRHAMIIATQDPLSRQALLPERAGDGPAHGKPTRGGRRVLPAPCGEGSLRAL
jgi:hypothetical protein